MFPKMRRIKQELSHEECISILNRNTSGTLALLSPEGYTYAVPQSYVLIDDAIYFHGAKTGHRLDCVRNHDRVSFCVTDMDDVVPEKFTTKFKSVIAFGKISILEDEADIRNAIFTLGKKYSPNEPVSALKHEIDSSMSALAMMKLEIEHLTGKQGVELLKK